LSTGEFVQFLGIASGSTLEVQTQLDAANMLKFGLEIDLEIADTTATEVVLIVNAAITTCRAKIVTKNKAKGVDRR
jgi:four helix bundle protein